MMAIGGLPIEPLAAHNRQDRVPPICLIYPNLVIPAARFHYVLIIYYHKFKPLSFVSLISLGSLLFRGGHLKLLFS